MKFFSCVLLVLGSLPVIIYPAVIIAGLMSFLGYKPKNYKPSVYSALFRMFIVLTLCYPIPVVLGYKFAHRAADRGDPNELFFAAIPLIFLVLLLFLYFLTNRLTPKM